LGGAFTAVLAGAAWGGEVAGSHVLAQLPAPIIAQAAPSEQQRPRLISLDFKDADINNILRILAEFSGLNIVTSEDVKGRVTVKLQNVPWQQALDSVVRAAKLAYVQEGNIIRVDKLENLTKEAEAAFRAEQLESERRRGAELAKQEREAAQRDRDAAQQERGAAQQEREAAQREREAALRERAAAQAAAQKELEAEAARRRLEFLQAPLTEEVFKLKYAHVGVKRVQQINFFTDTVSELEERGIEDAIRGATTIMGAAAIPAGAVIPAGAIPGGPPITGGLAEIRPAGLLSERGTLTFDQRTNSLIVRDVPENVEKIREFIERIDRPAQPVLIEARLVEMTRSDARSLGVIWGGIWTPRTSSDGPVIDVRGAPPGGPVSSDVAGAATPTTAANFPAQLGTLLAGSTPFGLGLGWIASNFALDIQLQALEGERRARVLSSPSLMTVDNQPATVASGRKFPIISITGVAGAQQASITFQDVTTRLQVTPRVVGNGRIVLAIAVKDEVEVERINTAFLIAPVVATRQTVTQADVEDGGTVVISGLRQEAFQNDDRGVPWLSKVPVLGWLFKSELTETTRRELVVFLTAKIVTGPGQSGVAPAPALPTTPGVPAPPGVPAAPGMPAAPGLPVPPGSPTSPGGPAVPAPPGGPVPPGPRGEGPTSIHKSVSAAPLTPVQVPAIRPTPAFSPWPSGER
jgi:type IV pilus assembly protein PilQ